MDELGALEFTFTELSKALLGLMDILIEPGGVGCVTSFFEIGREGVGHVASGRLDWWSSPLWPPSESAGGGQTITPGGGGAERTGVAAAS